MHKTVNDIIAKKGSKKISVVTSYDYTMATLCDQVDILLVGDSAGMVMLGYENTAPVTMDEMVLFTKAVSNGREMPSSWLTSQTSHMKMRLMLLQIPSG